MDTGFDGDHQRKEPLPASKARELSDKKRKPKDKNYELVIHRLYKLIENTAAQGFDSLEFTAPKFVLDGSIADPILLARKLKAKLVNLGYKVERNGEKLTIEWK